MQTLKEAWPETAAANKKENPQSSTHQENKNDPNPVANAPQESKIRELKALVEMPLDGAGRDRNAGSWESSSRKSIICDTEELGKERTSVVDTDDGRLLAGLDKED